MADLAWTEYAGLALTAAGAAATVVRSNNARHKAHEARAAAQELRLSELGRAW